MKNIKRVLIGGFLFVGGAVIMNIAHSGNTIPQIGGVIALLGLFALLYSFFKPDNDKQA
ncbi:MAG: hypothetical protein LBR83_10545 [Clostridiales bacterium]|jgi:uncharacterized membrane protein YgdD (TMEM256/DUF423 family)|nr:hypothetical protein [Clostridiales bacterium]